jgi:hypothetical protein
MADGNLLRLGGFSGLLAVVSMIPAYLVGYPGAPGSLLEAQPTLMPSRVCSCSPTEFYLSSTSSSSSCSLGCCTGCLGVPGAKPGE